jgi:recombination protein RecA
MAALAATNLELLANSPNSPNSPNFERLERLDRLDAATLARLGQAGVLQGTNALAPTETVLSLDWPELERVLPDRGLPRGVVEIASPITKQGAMRGGATTIALSAVRAVHAADARGWCAWITEANAPPLYAPAVAQAGVDLDRLLIVRPSPADLARTVVKVAASGAFDLVVVDAPAGLDGKLSLSGASPSMGAGANTGAERTKRASTRARVDGSVVVRKLALAAEEKGTTFIVLTNIYTSRAVPWPVALRMEVERRPEAIAVRVTKDRRGRASSQHVVRVAC